MSGIKPPVRYRHYRHGKSAGIIEEVFLALAEDTTCLQDITLEPGEMRIGDNFLCLHTLSDPEDLPSSVATDSRYERLSTDRSDCRLSFAAPIGVLLTCNHIVNQYLFIDDSTEEPAQVRADRPKHALALALQPFQPDKP